MKRGWKLFWIIAGSIVCVGAVMCLVGVGMGATIGNIKDEFATSQYAVFDLREWDTEEYWEDGDNRDASNHTEEKIQGTDKVTQSETVTLDFLNINELEVTLPYGMVHVITHKSDHITVDTTHLRKELRAVLNVSQEEGELQIESANDKFWSRYKTRDAGYLEIYIPDTKKFTEVSFDVNAGVVQIENVVTNSLNLDIGIGKAEVHNFQVEELDVTCGAGEVILNGLVIEEADLECGIGAISANFLSGWKEFDYEIECGIGELEVDSERYSGLIGKKKIDNDAARLMQLKCGVGVLKVTFQK